MKNHIRILGWLYIVTCGLALAAGLTLCVLLALDGSTSSRKALEFIVPPFLLVACFGLIPGLAGGIGILRSRPWARMLLLILSAFLLPLLPVGTALGLYGFWTLWKPEMLLFSADSASSTARPFVRAPSPFFNLVGVMACVAAGFFLVLKIGFITHHDPQPALIESRMLTAAAVLILFVGAMTATRLTAQSVSRAVSSRRIRKETQVSVSAHREARRRRVAELASDPARAQYAPLVERGENWSDEHITYYETSEMTATCPHLQPIERAMRGTGIQTHLYKGSDISAACRINFPALQRTFDTAPPVRYAEFYQGERSDQDHPTAFLICDEHKSMIHTVHPEASAKDVPWFPAS